ncbi:MAG TPA: YggT family protein [Polyangiaceae bacterium]|nr:YggT family protein [Polyangiaceae bacterium]
MALVFFLLDLYSFVVFVSVALSWLRLSPDNPVVRVTSAVTEPVLAPLRRVIPPVGGFDITPVILLLAIQLVRRLLGG